MSENLPTLANANTEDRWFAIVERVLADPALPIENLREVLTMRNQERDGMALETFNRNLASAQAEIEQIAKDKPNPAFRSMYSSLAAVDKELRPVREKFGFSWLVSQAPAENPATHVRFTGTLALGRCEKIVYLEVAKSNLEGPKGGRVAQTAVQETGSITSYMRRYLAMLAFDIVPVDDPADNDGQTQRPPQKGNSDWHQQAGDRDPWVKWVDTFIYEARRITNAEEAHALLERDSVVKNYTAIPHGFQRNRFLRVHQEVTDRWLPKRDDAPPQDWDDPVKELIAEIETLDVIGLNDLQTSAEWRAKVRDLFPPDQDRLAEAIEQRKAALHK